MLPGIMLHPMGAGCVAVAVFSTITQSLDTFSSNTYRVLHLKKPKERPTMNIARRLNMATLRNGKLCYTAKSPFGRARIRTYGVGYFRGRKLIQNPSLMCGDLKGETDTDYFYFHCPKCGQALRFVVEELWEVPTRFQDSPLQTTQHLQLRVHCLRCRLGGTVKLDSDCVAFHEQRSND